jgi:capsular exopolysaccharide synthesis family protein
MSEDRNNLQRVTPANAILRPQNNGLEVTNSEPNLYGSNYEKQARLAFLREWRRIIYRHKWLILSIVLIAMPFIVIHAYRAKSLYQATTTIEVRPEASSLSKAGEILFVDSNGNTKAETFIIKSQPVLKKSVVNLKLDQNARFLDVTTKRSVWEALTALKGERSEGEKKRYQESDREAASVNAVDDGKAEDLKEFESLTDPEDVLPGTESERARLAPYIGVLADNLKVEGMRDTRLIKISFTHTDPEIASSVANGVASSFITHNFQTKTERFTNMSGWLEESTRKLKAQVEQAEQRLANYSRENNIFSLEGKENLTAGKLVQLHDQVMRAETDRLLKQSLYEEVKQGRVAQLPEAFADPKTAELRRALNELAVTASQLSVKFGARHPKLQEIKQQMATIQEQIDQNRSMLEEKLRADYERSAREEESLKTALRSAKGDAVKQNQATIQYSILQQDLATAKSLYTDFLNKTSQANIQRAEQYNNVRMIEAAEPPGSPIGPGRGRTILIGFLISLAFSFGLAYLLETLNTSVRNVEDVSRTTQLPTLAVIPTLGGKALQGHRNGHHELKAAGLKDVNDSIEEIADYSAKPVLADSLKKFSAAAESYRMLRTSVLLSTAGHPPKIMLVTSGQPGDGKTTTVFNIAIAFTQLGARVVIVDCDMRKPRIHKLVQQKKDKGLSTFLTSGGDLDGLINPTPVPNLSILQCGHIPPNPSELISSDKMRELLGLLSERFDYIILDSPPLVTVTDPMILSTLVDGVILVAKSGQSKSELLRRACHDLSGVGAKVLGVVLNDFNLKHEGYDYYYYYRYYSDYSDSPKTNGVNA